MSAPALLPTLRVPQPPDDLTWLTVTVYMEAGGEPWEGKLAVAHSILNRARARKESVTDVVFRPWQFSAWNTDSPTRMRLDAIDPLAWASCYFAAAAAAGGFEPDPTFGATHYLNEAAARAARPGRALPAWVDPAKRTVTIGRHSFYRLD